MIKLILERQYQKKNTIGDLYVFDNEHFLGKFNTLELPWKYNLHNESCIKEGTYTIKPYSSIKYPTAFILLDVEGRSQILIHSGNFSNSISKTDTKGCILIGKGYGHLDDDNSLEILNSKISLMKLNYLIRDRLKDELGEIQITSKTIKKGGN